jgi:hypothetical protein
LWAFLFVFSLHACNRDDSKTLSNDSDFVAYDDEYAELGAVRCASVESISLSEVEDVMSNKDHIPSSDLIKYIHVAQLNSDTELAILLSRKLYEKGCSKQLILKIGNGFLHREPKWNTFINELDLVETTINLEAKQAFNDLYYKDQLIVSTYFNGNIHPLYPSVTNEFLELVDKYGFPSEELIGVDMVNDTVIRMPTYHVMMLHHYHMGELLLWDSLDSLEHNGEISCENARDYRSFAPNAEIADEMNARRSYSLKRKSKPVKIFTDNYKPVCEDTYLYVPETKYQVVVEYQEGFSLSYLDWNDNGFFREKGVDYFAFLYPDSSLSCYLKVQELDTIKVKKNFLILSITKLY